MAYRSAGVRAGSRSTSSPRSTPRRPRALRAAGLAPRKALGQHFLTDRGVLNRLVAALELQPDEAVIEVGAGAGALTAPLVATGATVVAVELDAGLARHLRQTLAAPNLRVIEADILALDAAATLGAAGLEAGAPYVVAGNLPYKIGAAVLRHFLEAASPPRRLVVMLQKEVAGAIVAAPGAMSLLSVATQVYASPRRLFNVPPRAFYPAPRVTSTVLRLDLRDEPLVPDVERERFFAVVRAGFSAPRKQLRNSLAQGLGVPPAQVAAAIEAAGIDPTLRPEDVDNAGWRRLAQTAGG